MANNKKLIRIGSYLLLVAGIVTALFLLVLAVGLFLYYPESSIQKKAIIAGILVAVSVITVLLTITGFEAMVKLLEVEREIEELEEEVEGR